MLALKSGRIINIKPGRVGGFTESVAIHDLCAAASPVVPVWCGGMLESGIGRAYNVALASLPNFSLPGDLSPSARYWARDVVTPEWTMNADGLVSVPTTAPGLGVDVDTDFIDSITTAPRSPDQAVHRRGGCMSATGSLRRTLGFGDLVMLTLGTVIGSGIFLVPGVVLKQSNGRLGLALLVWVVGGVLSFLGALTYAELGASKPDAGGLYTYIRDAFGPLPASSMAGRAFSSSLADPSRRSPWRSGRT